MVVRISGGKTGGKQLVVDIYILKGKMRGPPILPVDALTTEL